MASEAWISSAAHTPKPAIDLDRSSVHLLAMPADDRERALAERDRARRTVVRNAGAGVADVLDALGLPGITEQETAALALEQERTRAAAGLELERMPLLRRELAESMQELIHLIATECGVEQTRTEEQEND